MKILTAAALCASIALAQPPSPPPGGGPGGGGGAAQGDGIWLRNAYYGELETFDRCLGHQPQSGQYHQHVQPVCLRAQLNDNLVTVAVERTGTIYQEQTPDAWTHSPILGWSFDGYPIYGPYGYADPTDPTSPIKRMQSSFQLRNITDRTTLPDWLVSYHAPVAQQLTAAQYGPPINTKFPLGRYIEDFEYVAGLGDLDVYNGRFTITPQYPQGTYAYFVTIDDQGRPAFPYIMGAQYFGSTTGNGATQTVASDAVDYAAGSSTDALLSSFLTQNAQNPAQAIIGWDPSAGPQTTWPSAQPTGAATASGGVTSPTNADIQRIRANNNAVFINSNGLPSYTFGPWFASMNGGVFFNFPSKQTYQFQISRSPQAATGTALTKTPMGAAGVWVNGVAVFNALDGGSYKNSTGADAGGGIVASTAVNWSAASREGGPVTPGSLVTATANFDSVLATSTAAADPTAPWPTTLGGATVTIVDSTGASFAAAILYASPTEVNYQVPAGVATGVATVTISGIPGGLNIVPTYPGLFKANPDGLAIPVTPDTSNGLLVYATGLNGATGVSATINGASANVESVTSQAPGVDQIKITVPDGLAGAGPATIVVTAGGKPSNPVVVNL